MNKYIKIIRLDHWIKQFFIAPGIVLSMILTKKPINISCVVLIIIGFASTCFIASANYTINEYLDAEFDKYHPVKKYRPVVTGGVNKYVVFLMWIILTIISIYLASLISKSFLLTIIFLWIMGIIYNVKPIRTKDLPIFDVLTESINNAIRLLLGWFIVSPNTFPPCSIVIGYWMTGAFLMATKRFAEYRMINNKNVATLYRKSFSFYNEKILNITIFTYALLSVLFIGIFLIKYRVELILFMPFFIGLFVYYLYLSYVNDSVVQKPEKLYREKFLMIYCGFLIILFILLMHYNLPFLNIFAGTDFINIR